MLLTTYKEFGTKFAIRSSYSENHIVKTLSTRFWNASDKIWEVPMVLFPLAKQLDGAEVDPELEKLYIQEQSLENLNKISQEEPQKTNGKTYIECPKCQSRKIFRLRIDSDWTTVGEYYAANLDCGDDKEGFYTEEELNYDTSDRPDIDVCHCGKCQHIFEA